MATRYLDSTRQECITILRDETGVDFKPDNLDVYIGHILRDLSKARPYEVKETVTLTAAGKNEVSIASIEDLLDIEYAEYPVDKDPRVRRNVSVFGSIATIDTTQRPAGDESAYLFCNKLHTLTESQSTLTPDMEDVLVTGVVAEAAIALARSQINKVSVGGTKTPTEIQSWGLNKRLEYRSQKRAIAKQRRTQFYPTATIGSDVI